MIADDPNGWKSETESDRQAYTEFANLVAGDFYTRLSDALVGAKPEVAEAAFDAFRKAII